MNQFYTQLEQLLREGRSAVLATAVDTLGEMAGQDLLITQKALWDQGELIPQEPSMRGFWEEVFAAMPGQLPQTVQGGSWWTFFESVASRPRLVICGGGHIAQPLAQLGDLLDFDVTVIDDRPEFANEQRFPQAREVVCRPFGQALEEIAGTENTYFVIVTCGHRDDRLCLEKILRGPFGYVGMIGSRKKVALVMEELEWQGYDRQLLDRVHAPIGLRIGAQTPAELAVCIAGELIQVRSGADQGAIPPQALEKLARGERMALATVVKKTGSAPRGVGAKLLLDSGGSVFGTVGGGAGEAAVVSAAQEVLDLGFPRLVECAMTNQNAGEEGMVCGGTLTVLIEPVN